jgi:polyhydroxybutyrate depolymerase
MQIRNPRSIAADLTAAGLALTLLASPACGDAAPSAAPGPDAISDAAPAPDDATATPDGTPDAATADAAPDDAAMAPLDLGAPGDGATPDGDAPAALTLLANTDRPATVLAPATPSEAAPLLVLLHGHGASAAIQDAYLGASGPATARGYYVALPDGTKNRAGNRFWNAEPSWCCDFDGSGIDDTAYLGALIEDALATLPIDPDRVFVLGHSNGAYMAHRMACARADLISGIATIAGGLPYRPNACAPARPVANLVIHGTLDPVVLFFGQPGLYPGADETASRWASYNGCGEEAPAQSGSFRDLDAAIVGPETATRAFGECPAAAPVELWQLTGSGHVPAFTDRFISDIFDFFESTRAARAD